MSHGVRGRSGEAEIDATTARHVADTMQALSSPTRVRILARLRESPCSVNELADAVAMEQSAVSHHLRLLRHLGLVVGEREGPPHYLWAPRRACRRALGRGRVPRPARAAWLRGPAPTRSTSVMSQRDVKAEGRYGDRPARPRPRPQSCSCAHARTTDTDTRTPRGSTAIHTDSLTARSFARARASRRSLSHLGRAHGDSAGAGSDLRLSGSVALLADLIHNVGDALTAVPLGIAFFLRSFRGEKIAGLVVVAVIFISAMVALYESVDRFINPKELTHLWALAGAGAIGFLGKRDSSTDPPRSGRRLASPALIADGKHARVDGFVSLE